MQCCVAGVPTAADISAAVSGVPVDDVALTAVDVLGVPDVARVSDVAAFPTAVNVLSATDVSNVSGLLTYLVLLASLLLLMPLLWLPSLLLILFPSVLASLLLGAPAIGISTFNVPVSAPVSLMLWGVTAVCSVHSVIKMHSATGVSTSSGTPAVVAVPCCSS